MHYLAPSYMYYSFHKYQLLHFQKHQASPFLI